MAKNYKAIYDSGNVSIALEQRFFAKQETTRGELKAPTGADFFFHTGGTIEHSQPVESSPHKSGRHHNNIIKKKKEASFSISTYFNIDTAQPAAAVAEIDPALRLLWKSMMGAEDTSSGAKYTPAVPALTFSLFEIGDKWARQARGCFIQGANMTFPGDGEATIEWSGACKDALYVGMAKSVVSNDGGQTVTLGVGEGAQFAKAIGGLVMIIKSDGITRSTDTPNGTPRKIVSVVGDVVTLDGAALADADGSGLADEIYLVYYEPATPIAIDNPQTGLVGSFTVDGYGTFCARSISVNLTNDHELVNYCYGSDSLKAPFYNAGNRMTAVVSFEANWDETMLKLFNSIQNFDGQGLAIILGDAAGRRLQIDIPKVIFGVPSVAVPETGSVPVTFEGNAYQTAFDAADEISVHYK
jgi:hypothetical protein